MFWISLAQALCLHILRLSHVRGVRARSARIEMTPLAHLITRMSSVSLIYIIRESLEQQHSNARSNSTKTHLALHTRTQVQSWTRKILTSKVRVSWCWDTMHRKHFLLRVELDRRRGHEDDEMEGWLETGTRSMGRCHSWADFSVVIVMMMVLNFF